MTTVQFASIVDGIAKKKDGTLSIKLGTQELSPEETSKLFEFGNKQIWVAFKEAPLGEAEIEMPDFIPEFEGQKSYSQRLKEVLFRVWETTDRKKTSRQYYEDVMEKLIDLYKEKLS